MAERTTAAEGTEVLSTRDLVGWNVMDAQAKKVGTVKDLLVDRRGKVRFLDVDFGMFRKHVLLPIEVVDWGADALVLARWTQEDVRMLPPYDPAKPLTPTALAEMQRAFPAFYGDRDAAPARLGDMVAVPLPEARDFRLPKEAPDPRKWNVFGADGERVGVVHELLVDPSAMKVRYLDVDVADDLFLLSDDRHVLVPLDRIELRERGNDAWVQGLSAREVAALPAYTGGGVDPRLAESLSAAFRGPSSARDRHAAEPEETYAPE